LKKPIRKTLRGIADFVNLKEPGSASYLFAKNTSRHC